MVQLRSGWVLRCHPVVSRQARQNQLSDPDQIREFDRFIAACRPGMVLFDLGAHFGLFSLAGLHYGGPSALSVAVDPSPSAARMTNIQAVLNHVEDRLRVIEASASDKSGWKPMVPVGVLAEGYFVTPRAHHSKADLRQTRAVTLDGLVRDLKMLPTHVKIDVEGQEAQVLRGGWHLLSQDQGPMLFIELHNRMIREEGGDPSETLMLLRQLAYRTFALDGAPLSEEAILGTSLIRVVAEK